MCRKSPLPSLHALKALSPSSWCPSRTSLPSVLLGAIKGLNEEQGNVVSRFGLKLVYGSTLVSVLSASIAALVL
ncbi:hypothetical protein EOU47_13485 [Salmonella enterica]|nr:hypothetical protein [Salmonella enterica]EGV7809232.1 hypothetical protein [Salmonella enterica]